MADPQQDAEHVRLVRDAAGRLSVGLADEIARPLEEVTDALASAVALIDEHVATAKGPDPLSYEQSKEVRETIATAYLSSSTAARVARCMASAVSGPGPIESGDLNALIDDAVALVRHRFSASTELFVDLSTVAHLPLVASDFVLALARLLLHCADSTRIVDEAAVSIRSRVVTEPRAEVHIVVAENGRGGDEIEIASATALARLVTKRLGGSLEAASEPGAGSTFELTLPLGAR